MKMALIFVAGGITTAAVLAAYVAHQFMKVGIL